MDLRDRIAVLDQLGDYLRQDEPELGEIILKASSANPWFSSEEIHFALAQATEKLFNESQLKNWLSHYTVTTNEVKRIGLVLAGNIPMVGLHDVICVFLTGHEAKIKFSDKDNVLIPFLIEKLKAFDPRCDAFFTAVDRLNSIDAIIATGSDTSGMYFEKYFSKYPHIIRKHRNSVAVLSGNETENELLALGEDVFRYYGLGCRNVSKIYAPAEYEWDRLLSVWEAFNVRIEHNKYKNNFDFNYALFLMNNKAFLHNGSVILSPDDRLSSRIGTVHTASYEQIEDLTTQLNRDKEKIQCIVGMVHLPGFDLIPFGQAQCPKAGDYADNIDTIAFLLNMI